MKGSKLSLRLRCFLPLLWMAPRAALCSRLAHPPPASWTNETRNGFLLKLLQSLARCARVITCCSACFCGLHLLPFQEAFGLSRFVHFDYHVRIYCEVVRVHLVCLLLNCFAVVTLVLVAIDASAGPQPSEHFEPAQITNYKFGQLYAPHFDAFDVTNGPGLECAATGGQRVATVLMYLNDCSSGGGTYFPKLDVRFMPKKGTVVVFFPCSIHGKLDPRALHTGEPAVEEKWLCQVRLC